MKPGCATFLAGLLQAIVAVLLLNGLRLQADSPPSVPVTALAYSPDGAALVHSDLRSIAVRDPMEGTLQLRVPCDLSKITSIAFNGPRLVVCGGSPGVGGAAWIFQWPELNHLSVVRWEDGHDLATAVAIQPAGRLLAIASADHVARVFRMEDDSDTGKNPPVFRLTGHAGPILDVEFSPDGQTLVTVSADRSVKVWSALDGRLIRTFTHHTETVNAVAFRPRSPSKASTPFACATGSGDRTVRIWQPEIGRMVRIVRHHEGAILALAYAPDGSELFSAGTEGVIRRLDPDADTIRGEIRTGGDWIYALAVSPDGSRIASGDWTGAVRIHPLGE